MTHRPSVRGGVQDAVLDFYGVPVRAQDVRQFADRMRLLADKVGESARPPAPPPSTNWRCADLVVVGSLSVRWRTLCHVFVSRKLAVSISSRRLLPRAAKQSPSADTRQILSTLWRLALLLIDTVSVITRPSL